MYKRYSCRVASTLAVVILVAAAPQLNAEVSATNDTSTGSSSHDPQGLDEIVVTAQRREQKILDVPMSITAITSDDIDRSGATSLLDIASTVPGLSTAQFSPGQNRVQLRGVSSLAGLPTVGEYLDEMSINVQGGDPTFGADIRFIDLERIEVLRGPQATLYGEGSMGGTIRYITRDPDLTKASFGFDTTAGTVTDGSQLYRGNVVVNVPLVDDTLGMRFAGGYEKSPGWIDYTTLGLKNVNDGTSKTARLKTLLKLGDSFTASLLLMYQDSESDSQNFAENRKAPFVLLMPYSDKNRLASLVLNYDAGPVTLSSITSYMDRDSATTLDFTTLLGPLYPAFFAVAPPQSVAAHGIDNFRSFSEEVRVASKSEGAFTWTAGAYYHNYWESVFNGTIAIPNPLPFELINGGNTDQSKSSAVYAEGSYRITPAFESTLGVRYYRDEVIVPAASGSQFGAPFSTPAQESTFTSTNPRLVFAYHLAENNLVYASAAKGFRSGGLNGVALENSGCVFPTAYSPETLWTYEVGSNVSAEGGRVVVQSALYYNDWKNIQELQYCPGLAALGPETVSGGKAKGEGVDLQVTLKPLSPLSVTLSGSYNNSYYEDNSAAHDAGDRVDFVPRWTTGIGSNYDFHWSQSLGGRAHIDYQYVGQWSVALRNQLATPTGAVFSQSYGLVNARLSALHGSWEFYVFGQNLTDVDRDAIPKYGGYLDPTSMQPRTIGIGARFNY